MHHRPGRRDELHVPRLGRTPIRDCSTVARSIIFDQSIEIGVMLQLLDEMDAPAVSDDGTAMAWMGHAVDPSEMPGMATEAAARRARQRRPGRRPTSCSSS